MLTPTFTVGLDMYGGILSDNYADLSYLYVELSLIGFFKNLMRKCVHAQIVPSS